MYRRWLGRAQLVGLLVLCACGSEDAKGSDQRAIFPNAAIAASDTSSHGAANAAPVIAGPSSVAMSAAVPVQTATAPRMPGAGAAGAGAPIPVDAGVTPQAPTAERYDHVGTNPFVLAAHDPFSTFAADVDTASYDIFRRNAEHSLLPDQNSVRVEEFVNYFAYAYPAPAADAEHPFTISVAAAANPYGRDTTLLRVGIQAKHPPASEKKAANVVFLVDVSGSMQTEDKLPLVQYLLTQALEVLDADDTVSVVTYASGTEVRLAPTPVLQADRIRSVVNGLSAGGSTNGEGGIQLAYKQAEAAFVQGGINHIVLCTDGDFNVGVSSVDALVELIKTKRETGVTLTALGFGLGNLNDSLMERVSNAGNGIYSVISSRTQAARYAEDHLLATLMHVAKDMKIQVEWNPKHVLAYRLIGYEDRDIADMDFRNDIVDAGEVGAGHRVTALYEVVRSGKEIPTASGAPKVQSGDAVQGDRDVHDDDLVVVKVRYKQPNASAADPAAEVVQRSSPALLDARFEDADPDLRWTAAIASFAEILKRSPYATPTKLGELRNVFSAQQDRDIERKEFLQLFEKAATLLGH